MRLTNLICKNSKPLSKPYKLTDGLGLYLEIRPGGGRLWRFKYRIHGKEKLISMGSFPEVSLADAREKMFEARKHIQNDCDPSVARREKKRLAAFQSAQTFELVAREWHKVRYTEWSKTHADNILYRLENDVFPVIGKIPIVNLKAPDLVACLRKIEERNAPEMARKALYSCGQTLRYAVQTGRIERSFAPDLKDALISHKTVSYAAIESDELPDLLKAIDRNTGRLFRQTILAIKFMLLTFVRTSELVNATWEEFDFAKAEWVIPAERMKMRLAHIVPLSKQAIKILEEQQALRGKRNYVFPSIFRPRKPMSNCTILKGLERMGYKGKMTGHGFRALAMSTIKEKLGYRHEVVDRQLAHAPRSKIDKAYDRAKFLPERKEMMQKWADYIDGL